MARRKAENAHSFRSKAEQLNLFTVKRNVAHLEALNSPRRAFYRIWIEETDGMIKLIKESGTKGRVLDRRSWPFNDLSHAEKLYHRRLSQKLDPNRKSPRKYRLISEAL
jgi:hypothetical protein